MLSQDYDNPAKSIIQAQEKEQFPGGHTERRWWRQVEPSDSYSEVLTVLTRGISFQIYQLQHFLFYACLLCLLSVLYIFCLLGSYTVLGTFHFTHINNIYSPPAVCMTPEIILQGVKEVENRVSTLKTYIDNL